MSDKGYCGFASKADHDAYYSDPANYAAEIPAMEAYTRECVAERDAMEAYHREAEARMSDDDLVERVARAIERAWLQSSAADVWGECSRAAIEAMDAWSAMIVAREKKDKADVG